METLLLQSDAKDNLKLLLELAEKLGVKIKKLSEEDIEDFAFFNAIEKGRTDEYVETNDFLKNLRK